MVILIYMNSCKLIKHLCKVVNRRYSRRIMWLKVCNTNKNPKVKASLFLGTVKHVGGKLYVQCI